MFLRKKFSILLNYTKICFILGIGVLPDMQIRRKGLLFYISVLSDIFQTHKVSLAPVHGISSQRNTTVEGCSPIFLPYSISHHKMRYLKISHFVILLLYLKRGRLRYGNTKHSTRRRGIQILQTLRPEYQGGSGYLSALRLSGQGYQGASGRSSAVNCDKQHKLQCKFQRYERWTWPSYAEQMGCLLSLPVFRIHRRTQIL